MDTHHCLLDERENMVIIEMIPTSIDVSKESLIMSLEHYSWEFADGEFLLTCLSHIDIQRCNYKKFLEEVLHGMCKEILYNGNAKRFPYLILTIICVFHEYGVKLTTEIRKNNPSVEFMDDKEKKAKVKVIENGTDFLLDIFQSYIDKNPDVFLDAFGYYERHKFDVLHFYPIKQSISSIESAIILSIVHKLEKNEEIIDKGKIYEVLIERIEERGKIDDIIRFIKESYLTFYHEARSLFYHDNDLDLFRLTDNLEIKKLENAYLKKGKKIDEFMFKYYGFVLIIWEHLTLRKLNECLNRFPLLYFILHFDFTNFTRKKMLKRLSLTEILVNGIFSFNYKICFRDDGEKESFLKFLRYQETLDREIHFIDYESRLLLKDDDDYVDNTQKEIFEGINAVKLSFDEYKVDDEKVSLIKLEDSDGSELSFEVFPLVFKYNYSPVNYFKNPIATIKNIVSYIISTRKENVNNVIIVFSGVEDIVLILSMIEDLNWKEYMNEDNKLGNVFDHALESGIRGVYLMHDHRRDVFLKVMENIKENKEKL